METTLDNDAAIHKLAELIDKAVTSGEKELDPIIMKEIKSLCRVSDKNIEQSYLLLVHQLNQKHSEIRLAAFNICRELFKRSHCFREHVAADFQNLSKLVLDIDACCPLPPPVPAAKRLKQTAIKAINEWNDAFGDSYKKLRIGFNYLKQSRTVNFEDAEAQSEAERQRSRQREAKQQEFKLQKLKLLREEIILTEAEIIDCTTQLENGLALLVPDFGPNVPTETAGNEPEQDHPTDLREHGITNPSYSLVIEVKQMEIKVDQDNRDLVESMVDQFQLLSNRFQPLVIKWNITAAKLGADQQLQHHILDLKETVDNLVNKYCELKLPVLRRKKDGENHSDSDDSDLESVVDKEGYEETVSQSVHFPMAFDVTFSSDDKPGPSQGRCADRPKKPKAKSSMTVKTFDIDSYRVDESAMAAPFMSINQVESYWVAANDDDSSNDPSRTAAILTQHIELSEEFDPVKWACRAPLPSGKLCPRRDRQKCPLHGPIVARDECGNAVDPSSVVGPSKPQVPDWQDPKLLAEIKAATGVDLTIPQKGKRLRKNKHPNLTDIKSLSNTPRTRLEKKVFKKSVVRRIAATLDSSDKKTLHGKFSDQWNYAYDT